jgi:hypothetical protein
MSLTGDVDSGADGIGVTEVVCSQHGILSTDTGMRVWDEETWLPLNEQSSMPRVRGHVSEVGSIHVSPLRAESDGRGSLQPWGTLGLTRCRHSFAH